MTWLQQLLLALSVAQVISAPAQANECANLNHAARDDVHHQPQQQVETGGGLRIAPDQLDVPVVVDVLRGKGRRGPVSGETLIGIATTDGRNVVLQGPAVNEAEPVLLGPECQPLEPQPEPLQTEPRQGHGKSQELKR